jgi:hypothetical protein
MIRLTILFKTPVWFFYIFDTFLNLFLSIFEFFVVIIIFIFIFLFFLKEKGNFSWAKNLKFFYDNGMGL